MLLALPAAVTGDEVAELVRLARAAEHHAAEQATDALIAGVAELRRQRWTYRSIETATGIGHSTVWRMAHESTA